jgi:hypothetical protein
MIAASTTTVPSEPMETALNDPALSIRLAPVRRVHEFQTGALRR